ncbi:MAG: FkbM family methyltransferase [Candidatus Sericytochromatia bacterium]
MGLFSSLYNFGQQQKNKFLFYEITKNNQIDLDYNNNIESLDILREVFYQRVYSDYFPFYTNSIILDIGAHKGYFSIFASKNLSKNSKIYSFEPIESNFNILNKNLYDNNINNVITFNLGVYSENKELSFYLSKSENNSIFENYNPLLNQNNQDEIIVNCLTLKDIIKENNFNKIDFLKLDVEGSEYPIIFNSKKEVLDKIKTISIEFHDLKNPSYSGLELVKFLEKNNFRIVKFNHEPSTINNNFGKIIAISNF